MKFHGNLYPVDTGKRDWSLRESFGQSTSDGLLVIAPPDVPFWDGKSTPWLFQPIIGRPYDPKHRRWTVGHDAGYHRVAIVIDLKIALNHCNTVDDAFLLYKTLPAECHAEYPSRAWWDRVQAAEGMRLCGVRRIRRCMISIGLFVGGWWPWRRRK